jgi:hypothetical protein
MAYSYFRVGPQSGITFREYNLDFEVGPASWNRKDDVMLAQLMLQIVYVNNASDLAASFPPIPGLNPSAVDGLFGPTTAKYIQHFKSQAVAIGSGPLYPDNVLDPFRNNDPDSVGTISKMKYAYSRLMNAAAKSDTPRFDGLIEHPDTPDLLKNALKTTRDDALQYQFG